MKNIFICSFFTFLMIFTFANYADSKSIGERCYSDIECGFNTKCNNGVCIKKKEYNFGSSGNTGKPCNIDTECIGSGKCVKGSLGKSYCSGS